MADSKPVEFREFLTQVLTTYGVDPGDRSVPRWLARTVAARTGWMKRPPVTRTAIALIGHEVTVVDAKARRELGYTSHVSRERGLVPIWRFCQSPLMTPRKHSCWQLRTLSALGERSPRCQSRYAPSSS